MIDNDNWNQLGIEYQHSICIRFAKYLKLINECLFKRCCLVMSHKCESTGTHRVKNNIGRDIVLVLLLNSLYVVYKRCVATPRIPCRANSVLAANCLRQKWLNHCCKIRVLQYTTSTKTDIYLFIFACYFVTDSRCRTTQ